jgi:murein DD-endopeptidase MepM/ murein hydrolase activator NlpD
MRSIISLGMWILCFLSISEPVMAGCAAFDDVGKFKNTFVCPVKDGGTIRSGDACAKDGGTFKAGRGTSKYHNALDINSTEGTSVLAAKPGKVAVASENWGGMGTTVIIDHEDGDYSIYGHLKTLTVKKGACVSAGDVVGTVGYTGNADCLKTKSLPPHLHFGIVRAAKSGLADGTGPIAAATKNSEDWLQLGREIFPGDNLDLGVKDPEPILRNLAGCLK